VRFYDTGEIIKVHARHSQGVDAPPISEPVRAQGRDRPLHRLPNWGVQPAPAAPGVRLLSWSLIRLRAPGTNSRWPSQPSGRHTDEYNPARVSRPFHELIEANLRREAYVKGMSLDDIARASGISIERLLAIFSGDWSPDLQLVGRIAESVGLTAAELLTEPDVN
jgi:DNA-binding phage protein